MTTSTTSNSISMPISRPGTAISRPWFALISRSVLFLVVQVLIALTVALTRKGSLSESWNESARWWTFMAFLANLVSIYLLVRLFKAEGKRYKLVCSAERVGDQIKASVTPELVDASSPLYGMMNSNTGITFRTDTILDYSIVQSERPGMSGGPVETAYGLFADFVNAVKQAGANE